MGDKFLILEILLASPLILMIIHIAVVRLIAAFKINFSLQLSLILTELVLNIPLLVIINQIDHAISTKIFAFIVYNALGYSYFHFFNMSETARRIRILLEVHTGKTQSGEEFEKEYNSKFMLEKRLERLVGLGQIKAVNTDRYVLKGITLWFAGLVIRFFRVLIGLNKDKNYVKDI